MPTTLTAIPKRFSAGETISYRVAYADYPADQDWDLQLVISGGKRIVVAATKEGVEFLVDVLPTETSKLTVGTNKWVHVVTDGSDPPVRKIAAMGTLVVTPDLLTALDGEHQSPLEKRLAMLRAAINARITGDMQSYRFDDVEVMRLDFEQLVKLERQTAWALIRQRRRGRPVQTHYIRFGTPRG